MKFSSLTFLLLFTSCQFQSQSDVALENCEKNLVSEQARAKEERASLLYYFNTLEEIRNKVERIHEQKVLLRSYKPEVLETKQDILIQELDILFDDYKSKDQELLSLARELNLKNDDLYQLNLLLTQYEEEIMDMQQEFEVLSSKNDRLEEENETLNRFNVRLDQEIQSITKSKDSLKRAQKFLKDTNRQYKEEVIRLRGDLSERKLLLVNKDYYEEYVIDRNLIVLDCPIKLRNIKSNHPRSSYRLNKNNINILDEKRFWSGSKFLIIVTKRKNCEKN
ncbi:MAG: hypothetical protein AAFP89_19425 [Bacteroidota bacterium]